MPVLGGVADPNYSQVKCLTNFFVADRNDEWFVFIKMISGMFGAFRFPRISTIAAFARADKTQIARQNLAREIFKPRFRQPRTMFAFRVCLSVHIRIDE